MNVQVIEKDGQIEWAVIPYHEYQKLLDAMEMLEDIRAYDEAKANIQAGEELIPSKVVYALLDGENPIRVWREYRALTQQQLAEQAGISKPYLSQLESGKRHGTTNVLNRIAQVLNVSLEDLVDAKV
ncbi:MAG: helix-turn-helix domain-containing protein [Chloroflexi bacterium]|nr:helix-turn-helix domain-containing protein [Chloroflexota bacterium]